VRLTISEAQKMLKKTVSVAQKNFLTEQIMEKSAKSPKSMEK
jgi:hypothetical protein